MLFNKKGFTLIEVLISITLLSFIMLGVLSVTENSINTKDRTLMQDENTIKIYSALQRMEWDFSHLYSPLYFEKVMTAEDLDIVSTATKTEAEAAPGTPNPVSLQIFQSLKQRLSGNRNFSDLSLSALPVPRFTLKDKGDLYFFTLANRRKFTDSKEAYYAWVRYRLEDQKTESEDPKLQGLEKLVRYFVPQDPFSLNEIDFDRIKPFTLLKNVKSLQFTFWSNKAEKFVDSIKETGEEGIIRGVKIAIEWIDDFGSERSIEHIVTPLFPHFDINLDVEALKETNTAASTSSSSSSSSEENTEESGE